jgi:hypothetical protein
MPAQRNKVKITKGTEIVTLRAQRTNEKAYAPRLEDETWCWLHRELPKTYGLRFWVSDITYDRKQDIKKTVTIRGVRVTNALIVDNGAEWPPQIDDDLDVETADELDFDEVTDRTNKHKIWRISRPTKSRQDKCRLLFDLKVGLGRCFEFQIVYRKQAWAANVQLVDVTEEPALDDEPAHFVARFEVRFIQMDDDENEEENE